MEEASPPPRVEMQLRFQTDDPWQLRLASLIHAFDAWNQVELVATRGAKLSGLQLVLDNGDVLSGYPLFRRIVRSLRLLWPFALLTWIPGFGALAARWYPDRSAEKQVSEDDTAPKHTSVVDRSAKA